MIECKDGKLVLARVETLNRALKFINDYWKLFGVSLKMEVVK